MPDKIKLTNPKTGSTIQGTAAANVGRGKGEHSECCSQCGAQVNVMGRDIWGGVHPGKACKKK